MVLKYGSGTRQEVTAMGRPISIIKLTAEEEAELTRRVRAAKTSQCDSERARIVRLLWRSLTQTAVSLETGASLPRVNKWSQRFRRDRLAGLADKPHPGRPRTIPEEKVMQVIEMAGQHRPAGPQRLEHAFDGRGSRRHLALDRAAHLEGLRHQAAPEVDLQGVDRQEFRREVLGHGVAVPVPAGECHDAVLRREEAC